MKHDQRGKHTASSAVLNDFLVHVSSSNFLGGAEGVKGFGVTYSFLALTNKQAVLEKIFDKFTSNCLR